MFKRILVAVDGSETSRKALDAAVELARSAGGRLRVVHAFDDISFIGGYEYDGNALRAARTEAAKVLREASERATTAGVTADEKLVEAAGRRLGEVMAAEATGWESDLVVVGTHGRRGIGRALLGSGAEQVVRLAPVPVLVIRGDEAPAGG